jgi:SulP family sulfate permease
MWPFLRKYLQEFTPKLWVCWKEGYSRSLFSQDLFAGVTMGIISLPLSMAFAMASGLGPEKGLFTGIIAGFLISMLGGSRVQIGGPTGAFVVIVYSVVARHGYDGLALATLLAGGMMLIMALMRAGVLLKFIPYSVTTGFTAGIALTLFSSQIKDFLGLSIAQVPADFLQKWHAYLNAMDTVNFWAVGIGVSTLTMILVLRTYYPKIPGAIVAIGLTGLVVYLFHLPVDTIESKFSSIPHMLPSPSLPDWSWTKLQAVFPDAITIALLGAIESLLSAVVADGMTGHRHRSNTELFAQGIANIASVFFGGIPATGAVARTAANIKLGGKTPVSGIFNALMLLFIMFFCAPLAVKMPLSALGALLIYVAWNMSEIHSVISIAKGPKSDFFVLSITFLFTVLVDLTVAAQVGVILAAVVFLKKMSDATSLKACKVLIKQEGKEIASDSELLFRSDIPEDIAVFEIDGPLFFGIANAFNEQLGHLHPTPRVFILRMHKVPLIDATGLRALKELTMLLDKRGAVLFISGLREHHRLLFQRTGLEKYIGYNHLFATFPEALQAAKLLPATSPHQPLIVPT